MRLTDEQRELIQDGFNLLARHFEQAAALFYQRLFELDPALRPIFAGDMELQGRKFITMIASAVVSLDQLDWVIIKVRELGSRHYQLGVRAEDYDTAGEALGWTLEQVLGPAFTPEFKAAWTELYTLIADTMKQAAEDKPSR